MTFRDITVLRLNGNLEKRRACINRINGIAYCGSLRYELDKKDGIYKLNTGEQK